MKCRKKPTAKGFIRRYHINRITESTNIRHKLFENIKIYSKNCAALGASE